MTGAEAPASHPTAFVTRNLCTTFTLVGGMSWFHFTKQDRLRRNRELRHEYAETALKHTRDNVFLIPQPATDALRVAADEERLFEDYFGEPMPAHLRRALQLEVALWQRLIEAIQKAIKGQSLSDADYDQFRNTVREFLGPLLDLLLAEQEMINSCLVQHYTKLIDALADQAARVTL